MRRISVVVSYHSISFGSCYSLRYNLLNRLVMFSGCHEGKQARTFRPTLCRLLQAPDQQCYVAGDDRRTPLCLPLLAQAPNNPVCLCPVPLPLFFFLLSLVIASFASLRVVSLLFYTCARYEQQRRYPAQLHLTCSQRALDVRILETHSSP